MGKKIATTFIILLMVLSIAIYQDYLGKSKTQPVMDINGIKISAEDLENLFEEAPYGDFKLCSVSQNKCVLLNKEIR